MSISTESRTDDVFATEEKAMAEFDRIVTANGAFRMHSEVCGEYIQPRADTEKKDARIDRLLIPLSPAIAAGWLMGAIAVEGKCSDKKLGKIVSQALDYCRCVWTLKAGVPGLLLLSRWTFIYPSKFPGGDLGSVMAQYRIGSCLRHHDGNKLIFTCGGTNGISLSADGEIIIHDLPMGRKRGSR